ncbi:MAG: hypothetical protein ACKVI4_16625, partial [Actinomycetales bacterium]
MVGDDLVRLVLVGAVGGLDGARALDLDHALADHRLDGLHLLGALGGHQVGEHLVAHDDGAVGRPVVAVGVRARGVSRVLGAPVRRQDVGQPEDAHRLALAAVGGDHEDEGVLVVHLEAGQVHLVHDSAVASLDLAVVDKDLTQPLLQRAPDHPIALRQVVALAVEGHARGAV